MGFYLGTLWFIIYEIEFLFKSANGGFDLMISKIAGIIINRKLSLIHFWITLNLFFENLQVIIYSF